MTFVLMEKKLPSVFRLTSTGGKQRFPLAAFNRLKKERTQAVLEATEEIGELRSQLDQKKTELEEFRKQLHKTEERIRRRKRKVCHSHIVNQCTNYNLLSQSMSSVSN